MQKRHNELAIASIFVAASAGSLWAIQAIREHRSHLKELAQDPQTRTYIEETPDDRLTALQNLSVRAAGVRGFVNTLLSPSDPLKAAGIIEVAGQLSRSDIKKMVERVLKFPHLGVPQRFIRELEVQNKDVMYIFEQRYREKLLEKGYLAHLLTEVSPQLEWRQIGKIIGSQWRFPNLAAERHGFDINEHRFLEQFGPTYLRKTGKGLPEVQFLTIKKKKEVVGYVSFVVTAGRVFWGKDLSTVTLHEIKKQANPDAGEKAIVFLSATPLKGHDLGEAVATGMFGGSDYARKIGASEIYLPALSPYALIEQKYSGGSYKDIVNRRDEAGRPFDKWRERLTLFATPISRGEGDVVVNPEFMKGAISQLEIAELLDERERKITNWAHNLEPLTRNGLIYLKNSPHVAFRLNEQGAFEYTVPAFWMKMRKYENNSSLGIIPKVLSERL